MFKFTIFSLTLAFETGRYQDRRDRAPVDCTKTIWILATNALDPIITEYCSTHESILGYSEDNAAHKTLIDNLHRRMKQGLKANFGVRIDYSPTFRPLTDLSLGTIIGAYLCRPTIPAFQSRRASGCSS